MGLEANIVYLDEELKNNRERLELMEKHLKENPLVSIYKRKINNQEYGSLYLRESFFYFFADFPCKSKGNLLKYKDDTQES